MIESLCTPYQAAADIKAIVMGQVRNADSNCHQIATRLFSDCISALLLSLLAVPPLLLTGLLTPSHILISVPVLVVPVPVLTLLHHHTHSHYW